MPHIETHIADLRTDIARHMSSLDSLRSRLRGVDVLSAPAAQAAIDLRRIAASMLNDAISLQQAQRLAAVDARASLILPGV